MSIWTNPAKVWENLKEQLSTLWALVAHLLPSDMEKRIQTTIDSFLKEYAPEDAALIVSECWQAIDQLIDGKKFGEVTEELLTDLTTKSATLAASDLGKLLMAVQLVLQIGKMEKSTEGVFAPTDQATAEKVAASTNPVAVS